MTKKEFKNALLKGRGLCFTAVNNDFEKYSSVLLWACSHNISFDTQCNGSKAEFLYELIKCGENSGPFIEAAAESLLKCRNNGGWKVLYLSELLGCFANDGDEKAQKALELKYNALYSLLINGRQRAPIRMHTIEDFAQICQVVTGNSTAFLKTAEDIGRLFKQHKYIDASAFDWFYASKGERYSKLIEKHAKKSEYIAEFLKSGESYKNKFETSSGPVTKPKVGAALSFYLKRQADSNIIFQYADKYIKEKNLEARAENLKAFCCCPYPKEPTPIINDAKSNCPALKDAAWDALGNICHKDVRQFALENMQQNKEYALPVLIRNYKAKDAEMLEAMVKAVPIDFYDTTGWHSLHSDIIGMTDYGLKAPSKLLKFIYESTYCDTCREFVWRQMGKRRLLTDELLKEGLHDSNDHIRIYAQKYLKRRNFRLNKLFV